MSCMYWSRGFQINRSFTESFFPNSMMKIIKRRMMNSFIFIIFLLVNICSTFDHIYDLNLDVLNRQPESQWKTYKDQLWPVNSLGNSAATKLLIKNNLANYLNTLFHKTSENDQAEMNQYLNNYIEHRYDLERLKYRKKKILKTYSIFGDGNN